MHSRGILHRDIQLGNCAIGLGPNSQTVYMLDFGFSKQYIEPDTGRHIPDSKKKRDFIGNYWFSSVRVHCKGSGWCSLLLLPNRLRLISLQSLRGAMISKQLLSCLSTC